jgi:hypothetical protein
MPFDGGPKGADVPARYRVLVNGFRNRWLFASLQDAMNSIPANNSFSFEIYDTWSKQYVWTRQARHMPTVLREHKREHKCTEM